MRLFSLFSCKACLLALLLLLDSDAPSEFLYYEIRFPILHVMRRILSLHLCYTSYEDTKYANAVAPGCHNLVGTRKPGDDAELGLIDSTNVVKRGPYDEGARKP